MFAQANGADLRREGHREAPRRPQAQVTDAFIRFGSAILCYGLMAQFDARRDKILESECAAMRRLQHPNIVSLHEIFDTKDKLYIVME
jgi:serine/threonine protein kinase